MRRLNWGWSALAPGLHLGERLRGSFDVDLHGRLGNQNVTGHAEGTFDGTLQVMAQ
jgi:hypothetical protein